MDLPTIAVKRVPNIKEYQSIRKAVVSLLERIKDKIEIPNRAVALIKVNLCLLLGPETGATVDPRVARAIVEWLEANYNIERVIIAEADATHLSAAMAFKALGWKKYFEKLELNVEFCNLSDDKRIKTSTYTGRKIEMSEKYMKADVLISLAKLKTHSLQKITCTMKNLFGAIPEKYKIKYHPYLTDAICEFSSVKKPNLSIIDGLIGMDGKGPTNGFPRICRLLIAGTEMVATDHFCAKLMGFRPDSIPHISKAIKLRLGNPKYNIVGDSLSEKSLNFRVMPLWEELLRKFVKSAREKKTSISRVKIGTPIPKAQIPLISNLTKRKTQ